jgi:GTP 3',8-cyclase
MPFSDACLRPISYLRISVTDRCNLRCVYCMPPQGVPSKTHTEILRYEEIERVARAAAGLGISKVRLTGGEPLARLGIADLVARLAKIPGIDDLAMTTNGILLTRYAHDLARAGLQRVNVSLDTMQADKFARITRGGCLDDVLAGIAAAQEAGLVPLKINTVVMRGLNDDELVAMARLTLDRPWHVRFIEMMPLNANVAGFEAGYLPNDQVRATLVAALGELEPVHPDLAGTGPAAYYQLRGAAGTIGFISPISDHFCGQCNRLRLTADGRLRPCLLSDQEIDLRALLRQGAGIAEIQDVLRRAILAKPARHHLEEHVLPHGRVMSEIGG